MKLQTIYFSVKVQVFPELQEISLKFLRQFGRKFIFNNTAYCFLHFIFIFAYFHNYLYSVFDAMYETDNQN